ncbi:MAG: hypothetical protein KW802_01115 [Candidatus Doudnabacteria bacterium]|nr:hypothetical protein [Candidatus Doudnabacteria bacterium]
MDDLREEMCPEVTVQPQVFARRIGGTEHRMVMVVCRAITWNGRQMVCEVSRFEGPICDNRNELPEALEKTMAKAKEVMETIYTRLGQRRLLSLVALHQLPPQGEVWDLYLFGKRH